MKAISPQALSTLLRDEDPHVVSLLREQLYDQGHEDLSSLEKMARDGDALVSKNLRELIAQIRAEQNERDFILFCHGFSDSSDLEEAAWALASVVFPDLDMVGGRETLDAWARRLKTRLSPPENPVQSVRELTRFVSRELGFRGNTQDYYNPDNCFLNQVIERKLGIPISLSLIYLLLSHRAGLPVQGVGMPGHFICRWQDVFFDPFREGTLLSREDCERMLADMGYEFQESYLAAASNKTILIRMINNLVNFYAMREDETHQQKMFNFLVALQS
ncbi:MAG: transglutaminase-like domain-containing protein [Verrucomicrobiae bacterium]|nr:transglutaminase-like domain-containing protein [Verrucomicrobiae bacterium]